MKTCRKCGCTEKDCRQCIEKTGEPCFWVDIDLCSACLEKPATQTSDKHWRYFIDQLRGKGLRILFPAKISADDRRAIYKERKEFLESAKRAALKGAIENIHFGELD